MGKAKIETQFAIENIFKYIGGKLTNDF